MRKSLVQMVILVVIGAAVGLGYNAVSPKGIPVQGGKQARLAQDGARMVNLDEVRYFKDQPGTLFVDARSIFEFKLGHIVGALNLPADNFDPVYPKVAAKLKQADLIIVYCSGDSCGTSEEVAKKLIAKGIQGNRVAIFSEGLPGWMGANLPIRTGDSP